VEICLYLQYMAAECRNYLNPDTKQTVGMVLIRIPSRLHKLSLSGYQANCRIYPYPVTKQSYRNDTYLETKLNIGMI